MNHSLGFSPFIPFEPSIANEPNRSNIFQIAVNRIAKEKGLIKACSLDMSMRQYFIHPPTKGVYYVENNPWEPAHTPIFMPINSSEILRINGF